MKTISFLTLVLGLTAFQAMEAADGKKTRDEMVIEDRVDLKGNSDWIYNDIETAKDAARQANKPLLIVFRCIP
ncbi:MAG: hypothetical protein CMO55_08405 [Verrucomicrobiales bacterium]|nr:hypothetical protein [Verrucomicrobiales bacterium]